MIDGLDTGINEFNNYGFDLNIANYINYHTRTTEVVSTVQDGTKNTQNTLNSARSMTSTFEAITSVCRSFSVDKPQGPTEKTSNQGRNYSMTCIDKMLTSIPQEVIQKQTILTVLDISRNKFEHFPLEILLIKPLRVLKMDHNKIKYIPSDILKLSKLEVLSISFNLIQRVPPSLGKIQSLIDLNLESNVIDDFGKEIEGLKNLKILNLLQNKMSILSCGFKELVNLEEFSFEWFKYAQPSLSQNQKGKDGHHYLSKLKNKLNELALSNRQGITFQEFVNIFSTRTVNFQCIDQRRQSILHLACLNEDLNVMKLLLRDHSELLEVPDRDGSTPLCTSLLNDKSKSAYFLLKNGANTLVNSKHNGNPIHIAAKRLNPGAIKEILKEGEDPNRIDNKGNTPLHYATMLMVEGYSKASSVMQILLEYGANPNAKNKENWAPLHIIARKRDHKSLKWILSHNLEAKEIHGRDEIFKVNQRGGGYKWTPMHIAAYTDTPELIKTLGEAEIDMFKKSTNGFTPKMIIKKSGVSYKLLQKYERNWINKNVLFKKDPQQESLTLLNLKNLDSNKEIKNASKNKFGEAYFQGRDMSEISFHRTKLKFCAPLMGSGLIFKGRDSEDDSYEISPETEPNSESSDEDLESDGRNLLSEISENVKVHTDVYTTTMPFDNKCEKSQDNIQKYIHHPSLKKKNSTNIFQVLEIDFRSRFNNLRFESCFSLSSCSKEIFSAKETIVSERICFSDKLQLIFGLKLLYFQIVDHVFQTFYGLGNKESFPWYVLQESMKRAKDNEAFILHRSAILEIIAYYEVVPQGLVGIFLKLDSSGYESRLIKLFICRILADLKYFPAIDFLENLLKTSSEKGIILREAKQTLRYLKTILKAKSIEMKENTLHAKKVMRSKSTRILQPRNINV